VDLEDELGVDLFRLSPRGAALTAEGELFLTEAEAISKQAEDSVQKGSSAGAERVRRVTDWIRPAASAGFSRWHRWRFKNWPRGKIPNLKNRSSCRAREPSLAKNSSEVADDQLLPSITPAILHTHFVQLRLQLRPFAFRRFRYRGSNRRPLGLSCRIG
jgi:hypothetical protein